ncbi:hypothetical protein QCE47_12225 [Caballeronia sp. LZ025]|uniref:cytidylyltransferase domain-containing protein n=1 Tax=Caballeronia TaxID=1827195 RepID=UPI001FD0C2C1|nr:MULTISPECIES: hypothetical protein [Caballeronia]MDR5733107.1 hypothetical protein [Caballeronia sp. LZ025]
MTTVAIIPARGGSKRIAGKNTKLFGGKPIIGWAIEAALRASCFDRVVVSTDCERIHAGKPRPRDFGAGREVPCTQRLRQPERIFPVRPRSD